MSSVSEQQSSSSAESLPQLSSSSEPEEEVENKADRKRERSPEMEEEEEAVPSGASAPEGTGTPPLPREGSPEPPAAEAAGGSGEEDSSSSYEIDIPKGTDRIKRSATAKFRIENRVLIVTVQKGKKKTKHIECPFIDSKQDVLAELKKAMIKRKLDYMDSTQAAVHAPKIFWNGIHHFGSFTKLDQALDEAGVPNGKRRQKRSK